MEIYLKKGVSKDMNEVKRVAAMIKETKLNEIATEFSIDLNKLQVEVQHKRHPECLHLEYYLLDCKLNKAKMRLLL